MHINLDLLESVHYICSMLLEVPQITVNKTGYKSKQFKRLLDNYDKQTFYGPPETTKDFINSSARALMIGDWETSYKILTELSIWSILDENVLVMCKEKIKIAAMKTYILTNSIYYQNFDKKTLSEMFDLENNNVYNIISSMIIKEELCALWSEDGSNLHIIDNNFNDTQCFSEIFSEKISLIIDYNSIEVNDQKDKDKFKKKRVNNVINNSNNKKVI
jgi:translation initiation factor 3 subunit C